MNYVSIFLSMLIFVLTGCGQPVESTLSWQDPPHSPAIRVTEHAHYALSQAIEIGLKERDLKAVIDHVYAEAGAEPCFSHIVGSGPHSTVIHYSGGYGELEDGHVMVVDIGAKFDYCADMTRTYPVNGQFTQRQWDVYNLVLSAKNSVALAAQPGGLSLNDMTTWVRNFFHESPLRAKDRSGRERTMDYFFTHALGHYLGTEVHPGGDPSRPLAVGDVFTIEPGIYIDREDLGVRIEDAYIMTSEGAVNLTTFLPTEAAEIQTMVQTGVIPL